MKRSRQIPWLPLGAVGITLTLSFWLYAPQKNIDSDFIRKLDQLPEQVPLNESLQPYSDYRWPNQLGGITRGYLRESKQQTRLFGYAAIQSLNPSERYRYLKALPAAAKLDLLHGDYSYSYYRKVLSYSKSHLAEDLSYESSICASILAEPLPQSILNPNGLMVPFSSSDMKGLLAQKLKEAKVKPLTNRVYVLDSKNAALDFHLALTNLKGLPLVLRMGFGQRKETIWKALIRYNSDIRLEEPNVYRVQTEIEVARERAPQWEPYELFSHASEIIRLEYLLGEDSSKTLTYGRWISPLRILEVHQPSAIDLQKLDASLSRAYRPASIHGQDQRAKVISGI